jgi:hypothetical protein
MLIIYDNEITVCCIHMEKARQRSSGNDMKLTEALADTEGDLCRLSCMATVK